jgi:hypothetical protein
LLRRDLIFVQAFLLEEGKGHHGEHGMVMKAAPRQTRGSEFGGETLRSKVDGAGPLETG